MSISSAPLPRISSFRPEKSRSLDQCHLLSTFSIFRIKLLNAVGEQRTTHAHTSSSSGSPRFFFLSPNPRAHPLPPAVFLSDDLIHPPAFNLHWSLLTPRSSSPELLTQLSSPLPRSCGLPDSSRPFKLHTCRSTSCSPSLALTTCSPCVSYLHECTTHLADQNGKPGLTPTPSP